ncbi:V-type ATP synthase subunit I [Planctomycetota bacterium]
MILPMQRVTFIGLVQSLDGLLGTLQDFAAAEPTGSRAPDSDEIARLRNEIKQFTSALQFLPRPEATAAAQSELPVSEVVRRIVQIRLRLRALDERSRRMEEQLQTLAPLGEFEPDRIIELRDEGIFVAPYRTREAALTRFQPPPGVELRTLATHRGHVYVAAISQDKPAELPFEPIPLPDRSPARIRRKLEVMKNERAKLAAELTALGTERERIKRTLAENKDRVAWNRARLHAEIHDDLFLFRCWAPAERAEDMEDAAATHVVLAHFETPGEQDTPPTALRNHGAGRLGEPMVNLYDTPTYRDMDPCGSVFVFFAIFFGIIVADAGYGLIMLALSLVLNIMLRKGRGRELARTALLLSLSCVVYGVLTASYLGVDLRPDHLLRRVAPLAVVSYSEFDELKKMMLISLWMGGVHLSWVNIRRAMFARILSPLGWVAVLAGAVLLTLEYVQAGAVVIAGGLAWTALLTAYEGTGGVFSRVWAAISVIFAMLQMFTDILSYLRLFALGMASAYIARTFNMLGELVWDGAPIAIGLVACPLILLVGHAINFVLCIMGGVIHGLRLNFIESYHWCFEGGGRPFKPLSRIARKQKRLETRDVLA